MAARVPAAPTSTTSTTDVRNTYVRVIPKPLLALFCSKAALLSQVYIIVLAKKIQRLGLLFGFHIVRRVNNCLLVRVLGPAIS